LPSFAKNGISATKSATISRSLPVYLKLVQNVGSEVAIWRIFVQQESNACKISTNGIEIRLIERYGDVETIHSLVFLHAVRMCTHAAIGPPARD
jgi:hypothetical protein